MSLARIPVEPEMRESVTAACIDGESLIGNEVGTRAATVWEGSVRPIMGVMQKRTIENCSIRTIRKFYIGDLTFLGSQGYVPRLYKTGGSRPEQFESQTQPLSYDGFRVRFDVLGRLLNVAFTWQEARPQGTGCSNCKSETVRG